MFDFHGMLTCTGKAEECWLDALLLPNGRVIAEAQSRFTRLEPERHSSRDRNSSWSTLSAGTLIQNLLGKENCKEGALPDK